MEINFGQIILQAINFGLLVFLLTKFLYRPVVKLLEDRTKKIDDGLQAAEANLVERAKIEELKGKELIKAEKEAAALLEQAKDQAQTTGKKLVEEAKAAAKAEAVKEYQLFEEKMIVERGKLKAEVATLVIDTTKSMLKGALTADHQQAILQSQLKALKTRK